MVSPSLEESIDPPTISHPILHCIVLCLSFAAFPVLSSLVVSQHKHCIVLVEAWISRMLC